MVTVRFFRAVLALAAALLALVPGARPAGAGVTLQAVSGIAGDVSARSLPATLTLQTSSGTRRVTVTPETFISVDWDLDSDRAAAIAGDPGQLFGSFVEVLYDAASGEAALLNVETKFFNGGPITRVNGSQFTLDTGFGGPLTLSVDESTVMSRDFQPVSDLDDLNGVMVWVTYDPTTLTAATIDALSGIHRLRGTIVALDTESNLITVDSGQQQLTLQYDTFSFSDDGLSDTIRIDSERARDADLQLGMRVIVDYGDDEGIIAGLIQAEAPGGSTVIGVVGSVSLTSQTLMVSSGLGRAATAAARGRGKLVKVTGNTRITLRGRRIPLAGVPRNSRITARVGTRNGIAFARTLVVTPPRR